MRSPKCQKSMAIRERAWKFLCFYLNCLVQLKPYLAVCLCDYIRTEDQGNEGLVTSLENIVKVTVGNC